MFLYSPFEEEFVKYPLVRNESAIGPAADSPPYFLWVTKGMGVGRIGQAGGLTGRAAANRISLIRETGL